MNGLVGHLAARQPQVALRRLPIDVLVGQLAARRPQVVLPRRLPIIVHRRLVWSVNLRRPQVAIPRRLPTDCVSNRH